MRRTTMTFQNQRLRDLKVAKHRDDLKHDIARMLFLLSLPTLLGAGSGFCYGLHVGRDDNNTENYKDVSALKLLWHGGRDVSIGVLCFSLHCLFAKWYLSGLFPTLTKNVLGGLSDISRIRSVVFWPLVGTGVYVLSSCTTSAYSFYKIGQGSMECRIAYQHKHALT